MAKGKTKDRKDGIGVKVVKCCLCDKNVAKRKTVLIGKAGRACKCHQDVRRVAGAITRREQLEYSAATTNNKSVADTIMKMRKEEERNDS